MTKGANISESLTVYYFPKFCQSVDKINLTLLNMKKRYEKPEALHICNFVKLFNLVICAIIPEHKIHHLYSLITTHDDFDSPNPSSVQDACHI